MLRHIAIFTFLVVVPLAAFAAIPALNVTALVNKPFGGRIVNVPDATCPGSGFVPPFALTPPAGVSIPGLYTATTLNPGPGLYGPVVAGGYILGLHLTAPLPECVSVPPFNSVFRTTFYGTSLPGNI